jgi:predicted transposase/invertase (TIGR01784 family)
MDKVMEIGMEKGMEKGIEKGLNQGRQEGRLEATEDLARNMLDSRLPAEQVSKITGLSLERINELRIKK